MAFRGKPSKACERCRARRLRVSPKSGNRPSPELRFNFGCSALSVDVQARDAFFAYYVTSTTRCWDFLKPYYHLTDSPDHLALAIEAVSLAYLWHQVYSDAALATARERYISALHMINKL
jgi:hypothetical protein